MAVLQSSASMTGAVGTLSQSTVISAGRAEVNVGKSVSGSNVTVCSSETSLPHSSVAEYVLITIPPWHGSRSPLSSNVNETLLAHRSSAVGLLNVNSSPHEITISSAIPRISGAVVSSIRSDACTLEALPHSSVAVKVTSVTPSQLKFGPAKSFV